MLLTRRPYTFRVLFIAVTGMVLSFRLIHNADHTFIFDKEINTLLLAAAAIITILTAVNDIEKFLQQRQWQQLLPTVTAILFTGLTSATLALLQLRDSSPTLLFAGTDGQENSGASLELREDGTYKLSSYALGTDHYRGRYTLQDSLILLDKDNIGAITESHILVIRKEFRQDAVLYQLDSGGCMLEEAVSFVIRLDRRFP
ncbi:hypothetical protein ECE50_006170 [Chitinophaga sp. Mgbs1]|uniref:Uncharacterized protein n=1 Tax=Chitinophaga solisilvae TaxID=1233460 RepID=A0A433WI90_9BACT|nr:hypothetical protein [Chitinophaga solisilvae]